MKTGIIIPTRISSTRTPGKALKILAEKPILWHIVKRCQKSKLADMVILATSTRSEDDAIEKLGRLLKVPVYRGDLDDVLKRFYGCAKHFGLEAVMRVTHDCPLIDPKIIDGVFRTFLKNQPDVQYVSNCLDRIFPRGLDCEAFSFKALEWAFNHAKNDEREHVTMAIYNNPGFSALAYRVPPEYRANFRLTMDTELDYQLLNIIYDKYFDKKKQRIINIPTVIKYLKKHPEISKINASVIQKTSIEKPSWLK